VVQSFSRVLPPTAQELGYTALMEIFSELRTLGRWGWRRCCGARLLPAVLPHALLPAAGRAPAASVVASQPVHGLVL
jgi:hypothetical protein